MEISNFLIAFCAVLSILVSLTLFLFSYMKKMLFIMDRRIELIDLKFIDIMERNKEKMQNLERRLSTLEGFLMGKDFRNGTEK